MAPEPNSGEPKRLCKINAAVSTEMNQRAAQIRVTGTKETQAAIAAFGRQVASEVHLAVKATAVKAMSDVRDAIQDPPKTGREYKRGDKIHRASAPGEAPAADRGGLAPSIYIKQIDRFTQAIGSRLPYAFILEFGWGPSKEGTKRPAWIPASARAQPRLEKRLRRIIAKARAKAEKTTK
jgi:hypothetical protein